MRKFILITLFLSFLVSNSGQANERERLRDVIIKRQSHDSLRAPNQNDQPQQFVDVLKFENLLEMELARLKQSKLATAPWSAPYWPTNDLVLANRYGDPLFLPGRPWQENAEYALKVIGKGSDSELSPAEKYDMLVGDKNFTLTKRMIYSGSPYIDITGRVPAWFGICHGWAPAAIMFPRPKHSIELIAVDGRKIVFYPTDIKALVSLLWANGVGAETKYVGDRCESDPADNSRPECFDTNPSTWHIAVVNQIGVAKRSFVMDATSSKEVWNQPVFSYNYIYKNPLTGEEEESLQKAKVNFFELKDDSRRKNRNKDTAFIVNIEMMVQYVGENEPLAGSRDDVSQDEIVDVQYSYDLELSHDYKIIGGEWHSKTHPDFLWMPTRGSQMLSQGDLWLHSIGDHAQWNHKKPLNATWQQAAKGAAMYDTPLARIVSGMIDLAQ